MLNYTYIYCYAGSLMQKPKFAGIAKKANWSKNVASGS